MGTHYEDVFPEVNNWQMSLWWFETRMILCLDQIEYVNILFNQTFSFVVPLVAVQTQKLYHFLSILRVVSSQTITMEWNEQIRYPFIPDFVRTL